MNPPGHGCPFDPLVMVAHLTTPVMVANLTIYEYLHHVQQFLLKLVKILVSLFIMILLISFLEIDGYQFLKMENFQTDCNFKAKKIFILLFFQVQPNVHKLQ